MPDQLQLRGGTTVQHSTFTGASKEVTVDTTKKTVVVHDGSTAGGNPMLREDASNSALALGSQGTPSLKFTGDPNTGIYSPGADQVAISTGGSGRLFVDANGNVGLGKTPGNTAGYTTFEVGGTNGAQVLLYRTGSLDAFFYSSNGLASLGAGIGSGLALYTNSTGTSNERLRITSTGALNFVGAGTAGSTQAVSFNGSAPVNSLVIDSSGRVGIGTSSPDAKLEVVDTASSLTYPIAVSNFTDPATDVGAAVDFRLTTGGNSRGYIACRYTSNSSTDGTYLSFAPNDGSTGNVERMRITKAGLVGIGNTDPGALLQVADAADSGAIRVGGNNAGSTGFEIDYNNGGNTTTTLRTNYRATTNGAQLKLDAGFITFHAGTLGGDEKARIDTSGRLLVGTSTARTEWSAGFQVEGGSNANLSIIRNATGATQGPTLAIGRSRTTTIGGVTAVQNGDTLGFITFVGANGTDISNQGASISAVVDADPFSSGDTTDLPSRLVLSVTSDGSSATTEALRITNDRVVCYNQPAPTSKSAAATLTVAELKTGIIQYTGAADTLTLPTGTLTEGGFSGIYTNMTFEWSVINTGSGTCTIGAGTDHTIVGAATVAAGDSGRFASRRTAANTFVSYRLS